MADFVHVLMFVLAAASKPSPSISRVSSTVMSPSSGLRLGLSRNVRVKPLHRSLHVTT